MKELTKAEEEVMQQLWKLEKAFVKEIIKEMPEPRPAYNTVSTIIRILQQKGFVDHEAVGKSHRYFPLIEKEEYSRRFMKGFVSRFFSGSYSEMVSFFAKEKDMSVKELEQVLEHLKKSGK
jgi:predicted transcriptional regulator